MSLKHSFHPFPPVKLQENDSEDTTSSNEGKLIHLNIKWKSI